MICEINSCSSAPEEILHHKPQYGWVLHRDRLCLILCGVLCCVKQIQNENNLKPFYIYRCWHRWNSKWLKFVLRLISHVFPVFFSTQFTHTQTHILTILFSVIIRSILSFPQFSALYPEMVDALVFLDSYGFLPTDTVQFTHLRLRNSLQSLNGLCNSMPGGLPGY